MNGVEFITCALAFYLWHTLGITIGYHRLLAHRSFKCGKTVEYFFVLAGYLAFESSPICWIAIHREHHRNADRSHGPHSPEAGWWDAYIGWMLRIHYSERMDPEKIAPDLFKDPLYRFLEQDCNLYRGYALCAIVCIIFRCLLLIAFGPGVALASLLAGVAAQQAPLILGVVAHIPKFGYRNFDVPDKSTNVWWIALITMGEGWHNNHHAFPSSARSGLMKGEFDLSWCVLKLLHGWGLVSGLKQPHARECLTLS